MNIIQFNRMIKKPLKIKLDIYFYIVRNIAILLLTINLHINEISFLSGIVVHMNKQHGKKDACNMH